MKKLIVYYSLEGNTEYAANRIKDRTGADFLKLVPRSVRVEYGRRIICSGQCNI